MTFIVEMISSKSTKSTPCEFNLDIWTWESLLEFAEQHGWQKSGTLPDEFSVSRNPNYMKNFQSDYKVPDWYHAKIFDGADAKKLSQALKAGVNKVEQQGISPPQNEHQCLLLREDDTPHDYSNRNRDLLSVIPSFCEFLDSGSFVFAFDD